MIGKVCSRLGRRATTLARSVASASHALRKSSIAITMSFSRDTVPIRTVFGASTMKCLPPVW